MDSVEVIQVFDSLQIRLKLTPAHVKNLRHDVTLNDLDKMLHFVPEKLQLVELSRVNGRLYKG